MARLDVNYNEGCKELDRLIDLQSHICPLPPKYRKLIAEIILLRAFSLLEETICAIASKLACGIPYCDGAQANILIRASSSTDALQKMISHGRTRPRWTLSWSRASEIKKNMQYIIASGDHFMSIVDQHGTFIDEMRRIRNRIAHNNYNSRKNYYVIVRRYYGAYLNNVTPGTLLLSVRRTPILIESYLVKCRILIKQLVKV